MSHLTASILNRPLAYNHNGAFEFPVPRPVHPLSPPDTEEEFAIGSQPKVSMPMPRPSGLGLEVEPPMPQHQAPTIQETPGSRFRKISYLAASGARDGRERPAQPRSKWLVVVIPPAYIAQQHGQLGHTLSHGPSSRLSNGVLMPLFPTMYAQLTAIAREFNFPSTTGVCLYLHMVEHGMTFTPRVSDESWQLLWNHLFDARSPAGPSGLPIGGRLEFDIDRRQARWFEPWLASSHRHSGEISPSRAPSIYHGLHAHNDSRTEDMEEDDNTSVAPRNKSHVPRKLSLVDRFDTMSVRSGRGGMPRPSFIGGFVPPTSQEIPVHPLATISQADEPKTAKDVLENRVKSWRESASLQPSLLAATGQPSLEPANLPNSVEVPDLDETGELNLQDFTWSISSAGPGSDILSPIDWWSPVPSPHMDRRAEGSVLLTPTTISSLGPMDYAAEWSPISYMDRLPSPDMAWRQLDDVPPTPTTVSSQGPADYEITWSPPAYYRATSPDLAWRMMDDVPPTPSTASSMGPPEFWPPSPRMEFRAPTPDIGHRGGWSLPVTPMHATFPQTAAWSHVWPYTDAPRTWSQVWPYNAPAESAETWSHVWPYANGAPPTWDHVWPYNASAGESSASAETWNHVFPYTTADSRASMFKHVFPYHAPQQATPVVEKTGYPYFNLYPAVSRVKRAHEPRVPGHPYTLQVYKPAYPHFDLYPAAAASVLSGRPEEVNVKAPTSYPTFDLYPAVYPWLDIYPADQRRVQAPITVDYPALHVYYTVAPCQPIRRPGPGVEYPFFNIYPARSASASLIKQHRYGYPWFNIYMEVRPEGLTKGYPRIEPYPAVTQSLSSATKQHAFGYPWFNIYQETRPQGVAVAYPCIEPYPEVTRTSVSPVAKQHAFGYPWFNIYSEVRPQGIAVAYPCIEPYPAFTRATSPLVVKAHAYGYPWFNIYAEMRPEGLAVVYPCIEVYPQIRRPSAIKVLDFVSAYPNIVIYPSSRPTTKSITCGLPLVALTGVRVNWPLIEIYPAVSRSAKTSIGGTGYPHQVIYPAGKAIDDSRYFGNLQPAAVSMSLGYPTIDIYPAVYPILDIYPLVSRPNLDVAKNLGIYPAMVIYGVSYPRFDIYPSVMQPVEPPHLLSVKLNGYPTISIYTPLYPSFRIYDVIGKQEDQENVSLSITTQLTAKYPAISLYQPLYPHIELYPAALALQPLRQESKPTPAALPRPIRSGLPARPSTPVRKVVKQARWIPRKSHGQLRFEVMSETPVHSTIPARAPAPIRQVSVRQAPRRTRWVPRRSHAQLHDDEFPEGIVATPAAMYEIMRSSSPPRPAPASLQSRPAPTSALPSTPSPLRRPSLNSRPRSGTINTRPAVTVPTATPSNPSPEAVARMSPLSRKLPPPAAVPTRALPARPVGLPAGPRRISAAPRPASVFTSEPSAHVAAAPLSPLGEDEVAERSRTVRPAYDVLARSRSTNENNRTGAPSHVRRVSLVQERAKAYDTSNTNKPQIMSTLNQFPLPPAPPMPSNGLPTVSRLDRSKFAAFSGSPA